MNKNINNKKLQVDEMTKQRTSISLFQPIDTKNHVLQEILALSMKLLAIKSTSNNIKGLHEAIAAAGEELQMFTVEPFVSHDIPSLLIHNAKPGTRKFKIVMNAHLDTVPGNDNQYDPYIENDRLYGRGAFDMKAAAAVMVYAFKHIASTVNYPLALKLVSDEETGGYNGMKVLVDKGLRADFAITGECGSNFNIVYRAKGIMRLKLIAKGKSSHSAYPWRGDNAILKLNTALVHIMKRYPSPKKEVFQTTVNVTNISNNDGEIHTITPDYCEAILDIRYIAADEEDLMPSIEKCLPKDVTYEVLFNEPMVDTDPKDPHIIILKQITEKIHGKAISLESSPATSDLRHLALVGVPAIEFGPIGGAQHHDNEWVSIKSLEEYYQILTSFLKSVESMKSASAKNKAVTHKSTSNARIMNSSHDQAKKEELIALTSDLVRIPSVWNDLPNAHTVIDFVQDQLPHIPAEKFSAYNFPGILFSKQEQNKNFKILLHAHLDVMKGDMEQFEPTRIDGKLYGKGISDSKASAAGMIMAFNEVVNQVPYALGLQLTTDGTNSFQQSIIKQVKNDLKAKFVIVGEGTNFNIVHGVKGKLMLVIASKKNKSDGQEGMLEMYELVNTLSKLYPAQKPQTEKTTLSIIKIETNEHETSMSVDIRYKVGSSQEIIKKINSFLSPKMTLEVICDVGPNNIDSKNPYVKALTASAQSVVDKDFSLKETIGSSEANYYSQLGINAVEFSPAGYFQGHLDIKNEWVDIDSVYNYYEILKNFLLSIK